MHCHSPDFIGIYWAKRDNLQIKINAPNEQHSAPGLSSEPNPEQCLLTDHFELTSDYAF